jgi:hypothetical protein
LYLRGAFSIYRVDVLRKLGAPFSDVYEAYFDDKLLGARLRRRGYRIFHKAIVAGFISVLLVMARVGFLSQPGGLSTSPQPSSFPSLKTLLYLLRFLLC